MDKNLLKIVFICMVSCLIALSCKGAKFSGNKLVSDSAINNGSDSQFEDDNETGDDNGDGNENGNNSDDDDDDDDDGSLTNKYDPDGDGTISLEEYEETEDELYGQMSAGIHRVESDCYSGKCSATVTLNLYKVANKKVSSSVKQKSQVQVYFAKGKATVSGSQSICPTKNVSVMLEMSISYGGSTLDASDQSILIGARDPSNKSRMYIGLADSLDAYEFHNIDSVIGSVVCPDAKKISIRHLCRDQVLENDPNLIRCWWHQGQSSSCPSNNVYKNGSYPAQCTIDK